MPSGDADMKEWAKDWTKAESWDHRARMLCEFLATPLNTIRNEYPLDRLARCFKSYLAKDAFEQPSSGGWDSGLPPVGQA